MNDYEKFDANEKDRVDFICITKNIFCREQDIVSLFLQIQDSYGKFPIVNKGSSMATKNEGNSEENIEVLHYC